MIIEHPPHSKAWYKAQSHEALRKALHLHAVSRLLRDNEESLLHNLYSYRAMCAKERAIATAQQRRFYYG